MGILFAASAVAVLAAPATKWAEDRFNVIKLVDDKVEIDEGEGE